MPGKFSIFVFVLSTASLWAQHQHPTAATGAAVERVKALQASSLDRGLPEVSLEFFLAYEAEGAPVKWSVTDCYRIKGNPSTDREQVATICVEANIDTKDDRSVTLIVSLGTFKTGALAPPAPALFSLTVTDRSGMTRAVRRLSDLAMELHRPMPKWPRDMTLPASAALFPHIAKLNPA
jgi:hypothetical protein